MHRLNGASSPEVVSQHICSDVKNRPSFAKCASQRSPTGGSFLGITGEMSTYVGELANLWIFAIMLARRVDVLS